MKNASKAILKLLKDKINSRCLKEKNREDAEQKPLSMTPCFGKGFTLIELLVVVLIIGILSAVALPQYTKAVEKSRAAEALQILRYMHQQKEIYKLSGGEDAGVSNEDVGIELGSNFNCMFEDEEICCNKHWCYANGGINWGCGNFLGSVVARRHKNTEDPFSEGELMYDLDYQNPSSCNTESARIVCYNYDSSTDWCKMFKGSGNPI